MYYASKINPPIRRVSTNQSLSRDSTQSFNRVDVELTVFSRDSALGVRRGGSAGVGGRGGHPVTLGICFCCQRLPGTTKSTLFSVIFPYSICSLFCPKTIPERGPKSVKNRKNP